MDPHWGYRTLMWVQNNMLVQNLILVQTNTQVLDSSPIDQTIHSLFSSYPQTNKQVLEWSAMAQHL